VRLPIEPSRQPPAAATDRVAPAPASTPALRILVADDNKDGRELLTYLLEHQGHTTITADDGQRALNAVADFDPDVAILDIGMPGLNGYELARRLRAGREDGRPFLVALSGLGQAEDKARAAEAGFDHHFTKPVDVNALLSLLAQRVR
jgi:CheY-like chemotaxis protein